MGTALGSEVESVVVLRAARASLSGAFRAGSGKEGGVGRIGGRAAVASLSGALLRAAAPRACVPHAARPPHAATNVNNS